MEFDLTRLGEMHPLLAKSTAQEYAYRSAIGLGRHGHEPGVRLKLNWTDRSGPSTLHWRVARAGAAAQLDFHRVTEDTAEAVALAVVHVVKGWVVLRRLQRGEFADWLLIDRGKSLVAMEVSGVDTTDVAGRRMREKVEQAKLCKIPGKKAACVVELQPPRSRMRVI